MPDGDAPRPILIIEDFEAELWQVDVVVRPDLAVVDALARLHLVARRVGCSVVLRDPGDQLRELLDLVGLDLVETGSGDPACRDSGVS